MTDAFASGMQPQTDGQQVSKAAVLVVEDDPTTARVLQKVLERAGYDVTTAASASQALEAARDRQFQVVISDLTLPDGHGHELFGALRELQPKMKGIALSGHGSDSDVNSSREAGFVEHLVKPVDLLTLEAAIGRVAGV